MDDHMQQDQAIAPQQGGNHSSDSSPSTSRGPTKAPHQCVTIWEPVSLKQEWTIANFDKAMELAIPGMCMRSKPFCDESMADIHWQLCLYPGGKREENMHNVSLFLKMSSATPREYTVRAEYRFYFVDEIGNPKFSNVNVGDFKVKPQKGSHSWGLRNIPKTKVTPCLWNDKSLRIVCQIELIPEVNKMQPVDVIEKSFDHSAIQQTFIKNIKSMFNDDSADCLIICEDEEFKVHKFLLMAHSDAFRAMLTHDTIEKRESIIRVRDGTKAIAIKHLLDYLYSSTLPEEFSDDDATYVMQLADMYHIEPLKLLVQKKLAEKLTANNVCAMFLKAHLYNATSLMDACVPVFFTNSKTIMNSDDYATFKAEYPLAANCLLEKYVSYTEERTHPSMSPPHKKYRVSADGARIYGQQNVQNYNFRNYFSQQNIR